MSGGPENKCSLSNFMYVVTNVSSVEIVVWGEAIFFCWRLAQVNVSDFPQFTSALRLTLAVTGEAGLTTMVVRDVKRCLTKVASWLGVAG